MECRKLGGLYCILLKHRRQTGEEVVGNHSKAVHVHCESAKGQAQVSEASAQP